MNLDNEVIFQIFSRAKCLKTNLTISIHFHILIFVKRTLITSIQTRKLVLLEEFLRISDENLINKIATFNKNEKKISHEINLKPMSLEDFEDMINRSYRDSEAVRGLSHKELRKKVRTWK